MKLPSGRSAQLLAIALICAAVLLSLSMLGRSILHTEGPLHPWYHLALFAILGLLAFRSSTKPAVRVALLFCLVMLALGIEYMESLRYDIPLEFYDVRTDSYGVAIGAILGWVLSHRSPQRL